MTPDLDLNEQAELVLLNYLAYDFFISMRGQYGYDTGLLWSPLEPSDVNINASTVLAAFPDQFKFNGRYFPDMTQDENAWLCIEEAARDACERDPSFANWIKSDIFDRFNLTTDDVINFVVTLADIRLEPAFKAVKFALNTGLIDLLPTSENDGDKAKQLVAKWQARRQA